MKKFLSALTLGFLLLVPVVAGAVSTTDQPNDKKYDPSYGLQDTTKAAYGTIPQVGDPKTILGSILGVILAALGIIFLVQTIIAGIKWLTAQGSEDKITEAKQQIIHSLIGLAIVVSAYAIVNFVLSDVLLKAVGIQQ